MNQSGKLQKNQVKSASSQQHKSGFWVPNSLRNATICLKAGDDISLELLILRFVSSLNRSGTKVHYVTNNHWLKSTVQAVGIVERVLDQVNESNSYVMTCASEQLLPLIKKQLADQFPLPVFLTPDVGRSAAFSSQWLESLPPPYIGISWAKRTGRKTNDAASVDLSLLVDHLAGLSGTIVVLQENPSQQELDYIGKNVNASLLDCSDLYDDPAEMLAVVDLLDDHVGVPDLAQVFRSSMHKKSHVLWPRQMFKDSTLWGSNRESLAQWFPDSQNYFQDESRDWSVALNLLESNLRSLWPFSNWVTNEPKAKTEPVPQAVEKNMLDLIRHANSLTTNQLLVQTEQHVQEMVSVFNASRFSISSKLNIFVYHTDMGDAGRLQYKDVKIDLNKYDYRQVLTIFIESVHRWNSQAHIFLVTNAESEMFDLGSDLVRVIGLNVSTVTPMYERVNAMCAYVHSLAFDADTVFLDSDAFINADLSPVLDAEFDVAITARPFTGLMPVNEGVIVAKCDNPERVAAFFRRYLASYDALAEDDFIKIYSEDIRKWRGGQLSLNAVCYDAHPYSPYRLLNIHNTNVKVLPCDTYNYSGEYGQIVAEDELRQKVIIHLKGTRKEALNQMNALLMKFYQQQAKKEKGFVAPHFAIFNKMFNEPPFLNQEMVKTFAGHVASSAEMLAANQANSGALLADDMFVWFRNLGFLSEPEFVNAFAPYANDALLRARIWRVYMLCWALKSCVRVEGDFVDLGCYDGRTVHVMTRYIDFNQHDKRYFLYDLFENPTAESRKAKHGPGLYAEVCQLFSQYPQAKVIKGPVPESFVQGLPEKIAFAQIDLNEAEPELAALNVIYDRITPGGMIIFDDFGFKRYAESHNKEMEFFRNTGDIVFESPTGQGLFIKRG